MTAIAVGVLLVVIVIGVALLHRVNAQHDERIAAFHYGEALPGIGRRTRKHRRPVTGAVVATASTPTATAYDTGFGATAGGREGHIVAILRERKAYRKEIMRALYEAAEGNRLLGMDAAKLRSDLGVPERDLAAACTYLAGEGRVVVDWARDGTPAMITLTHQGIRQVETEEAGRG